MTDEEWNQTCADWIANTYLPWYNLATGASAQKVGGAHPNTGDAGPPPTPPKRP